MDLLWLLPYVIGGIVLILIGFLVGFFSRNSRIDSLTADNARLRTKILSTKADLEESERELRTERYRSTRSAEEADNDPTGTYRRPSTGRPSQPRTRAHGTVQPMPDGFEYTPVPGYDPHANVPFDRDPYPYEYERTERTEYVPADQSTPEPTNTPDTSDTNSTSSYGGGDFGSSSSDSGSSYSSD